MNNSVSKVVQILIKNTSTLDFSIPVLVELKKRGHKVTVIDLCRKKNSLSELYSDLINEYNIQYVSRENLLPTAFRCFLKLLDRAELFMKPIRIDEVLSEEKRLFRTLSFILNNLMSIFFHIFRAVFFKASSFLRDPEHQLSLILNGCDTILWDHRSPTSFYFKEYITSYLGKHSGDIFLLPHAPHMRDPGTEIYLPITGHLEGNYNYLLPLSWSDNNSVYSSYDAKFLHCGYPGFDRSWIKEVKSRTNKKRLGTALIIMRPFSDEGIQDNKQIDHYVLSYQETRDWLIECKKQLGDEVDGVHLKLHPSNSKLSVTNLLKEICFPVPAEILDADIYTSVANVDVVFGFYSTTLLIASAFGCNTYCMKTNLVDRSFSDWPVLEKVYVDFNIKFIQPDGIENPSMDNPAVLRQQHFVKNSTEFCANLFSGLS